ncbi:hypothetical protein FOBRF1_006532 [Fusarium oxysporum]
MNLALLHDRDGEDYPRPLKRQKTSCASAENGLLYDRYTIAWICALHFEMAAALAMMDEIHGQLPRRFNDHNTYTLGSIKNHNIVIACLPEGQYGNNNAASVLTDLKRTFPSICHGLMVGIGGGAPGKLDIHLGDIIVGTRVMQYDFGKVMAGGEIQRTATPKIPDHFFGTAVANLRARHEIHPSRIPAILQKRMQELVNYHRPSAPDHLFRASYEHDSSKTNCQACDQSQLEQREARRSCEPKIHYGGIASSNQVMKDAVTRDKLAQELDIICFEMEAAGLMGVLSCLPIRGICDYSDSHKAKEWQKYAAAVAAAYAREFLEALPAAGDASRDSYPSSRPPEPADLGNRRQQLLASLGFEQIDSRRITIKTAYSKTCSWFLTHPGYLEWLDSEKRTQHHGFLWIRGKPGAGKSIIMKFIYTRMKKTDIKMKALTVSYFFNARGGLLEKSVSGMYRSLLLQLLEGFPDLQLILDDPDLIPRNQVTSPPLNILKDLFRSAISSLDKRALTCFVDALDECDEQQVRDMVDFFEELAEQCVENNVRFQVCFSSRHYPYIDIKSGIRLTLEGQDGHNEDLKHYISKHLRIQDPDLIDELKQMMLEKSAGVFLWVALVVDILNKEDRHGRLALRRRLQEVPSELSELFKDILTRDQEHMEDLLLSILWILLAERPLKPGEYYHALWSGLSLKGLVDVEMPPVNTSDASDCFNKCIISSSKGLAEITKARNPTVQFIHESVRDFLIKDKGLHKLWPELGTDWESQAHETLKLCCNAYVFHEAIGKAIDGQQSTKAQSINDHLLKQFPFLEYASQFVLGHANAAAYKITQQRFISEFPVSNWVRIFNIFEKRRIRKYSQGADVLYILADRGHPELIRMRLEVNPGIDGGGGRYRHPLLAAMAKGNKDSVTALLGLSSRTHNGTDITDGLKSNIDSVKPKHTPVSWACEEGHLAIAAFLLDQGAQVGVDDLVKLVRNGNIEVVKMLLEKGADAAAVTKDGRTPLHEALKNGHSQIAKVLIEKGADARTADNYGSTPLYLALQNGHLEIAKVLIEKGADARAANDYGSTPLHLASQNGHLEIAKVLIEKGADVRAATEDGFKPLHLASQSGHLEIAKMLLEKGANVRAATENGWTPLHLTSKNGHLETARILLDKGADTAVANNDGSTPLHLASENGHLEIAKMLLEKGANAAAADNDGSTPLHLASKNGHLETARILLDRGADTAVANKYGWTSLHYASGNGHSAITKILLDNRADAGAVDKYGSTPLHDASRKGHLEITKILLDKGADTAVVNNDGSTPLHYASGNGHSAITKILLDNRADAGSVDKYGSTPLHYASWTGYSEIVKILH